MQAYTETAYAKINLALHVRRLRADGFHDIETLFAFADAGDTLTAIPAATLTLSISGPFAEGLGNGDHNLVLRTAKLLQSHFQIENGATLNLQKKLPVASGIGGGSADAAATARLLNQLWQLGASDCDLAALLAPLGADVPACVASITAFGTGTGTALSPVDNGDLTGIPVLLVNPQKPVATGAVFSGWDGIDRGALGTVSPLVDALQGRNDLEAPAIDICPEIAKVLDFLKASRSILTRMSGSGATCFALFESVEARDVARSIVDKSWWTMAGRLR